LITFLAGNRYKFQSNCKKFNFQGVFETRFETHIFLKIINENNGLIFTMYFWKPHIQHNCKLDDLRAAFEIAAGYWFRHR
jgi:hypothetical protein